MHRDIARIEEMDLPDDEALVNRGSINFNSPKFDRKRQFPSILSSRAVPLEILPSDGQDQQVSLVTADGHTIEILHHGFDPNSMSVPMTLVPSSEGQ